jgi:hypothetical protein
VDGVWASTFARPLQSIGDQAGVAARRGGDEQAVAVVADGVEAEAGQEQAGHQGGERLCLAARRDADDRGVVARLDREDVVPGEGAAGAAHAPVVGQGDIGLAGAARVAAGAAGEGAERRALQQRQRSCGGDDHPPVAARRGDVERAGLMDGGGPGGERMRGRGRTGGRDGQRRCGEGREGDLPAPGHVANAIGARFRVDAGFAARSD